MRATDPDMEAQPLSYRKADGRICSLSPPATNAAGIVFDPVEIKPAFANQAGGVGLVLNR
jgi:hypothetical protein